jgi:hypothetical protein
MAYSLFAAGANGMFVQSRLAAQEVVSLYSRYLNLQRNHQLVQSITQGVFEQERSLQLKEHHVQRNLAGNFGPNHYARFLCKNFKIYRGSRGKWGNRGIENDWKWRFPKGR